MLRLQLVILLFGVFVLSFYGCDSDSANTLVINDPAEPAFDAGTLSTQVTNPYFTLTPGTSKPENVTKKHIQLS